MHSRQPGEQLAVMVDPINATPLPFAYDNSNGGGRMLGGASNPLDSRSSSITYLPRGNARVPSLATIADPGFSYNVELIPMEFSSTLVPNAAGVNVVAGLGMQRQMVISVTNAADVPNVRISLRPPPACNPVIGRSTPPGTRSSPARPCETFRTRASPSAALRTPMDSCWKTAACRLPCRIRWA